MKFSQLSRMRSRAGHSPIQGRSFSDPAAARRRVDRHGVTRTRQRHESWPVTRPASFELKLTDLLPAGTRIAFGHAGRRPAQDIAVVGFADLPLSVVVKPTPLQGLRTN